MCWFFSSSPSFLSFLPSALCLRRLIILDYISCFSCHMVLFWIWPMGSSARDHGEKRPQSISSLLSVAFSFSVLEMAESINNYRAYPSSMAASVTSSMPHILSNLWMIAASHCDQSLHASSFLVGSFNAAHASVNSLFCWVIWQKVLFPHRTLIKIVGDIILWSNRSLQ